MKNIKRTLITVVAMLLVCVVSVAATLAYLYDKSDTVVNTFTVGNVEISLDEKDVDNSSPDKDRDVANKYKLTAGATLEKDPTVHVSNYSEESYIFVEVIVDDAVAAVLESSGEKSIASQMTKNGWELLEGNIYAYNKTVTGLGNAAALNIPVFTTISVKSEAKGEDLAAAAEAKITITAYAIQKDGISTPAAAWAELQSAYQGK